MSEIDRKKFWSEVGNVLRLYRKQSVEYSTLERLGEALGLSKSRVHDIESARSWKKGVSSNTIAEFQDLLKIPQYEMDFICKKHEFYPFVFPEQIGSRDVYLSVLDVDDNMSALQSKFDEQTCIHILMAYGAFADHVSFQFSAPLKINGLSKAIQKYLLAFQRNERWEPFPIFRFLRSKDTPLFTDYLLRRTSFLMSSSGNPELTSYVNSNAFDTSLVLDDRLQDSPLIYKKTSIGWDISQRIKMYFSSESRASKGYQIIYPYISDPSMFQTFKVKSLLMENSLNLSERAIEFRDVGMRKIYHTANARANGSLLDTDYIWKRQNIGRIFNLLGLTHFVNLKANEAVEGKDMSNVLFQIRASASFKVLKGFYFECQSQGHIDDFIGRLEVSARRISSKGFNDPFSVLDQVVMDIHSQRALT